MKINSTITVQTSFMAKRKTKHDPAEEKLFAFLADDDERKIKTPRVPRGYNPVGDVFVTDIYKEQQSQKKVAKKRLAGIKVKKLKKMAKELTGKTKIKHSKKTQLVFRFVRRKSNKIGQLALARVKVKR